MGIYIYRITAKKVRCSDGKEANVAVFAYKPFFSRLSSKENSKMHFASGCVASERMAKIGKILDRFVIGDQVYDNTRKSPYMFDSDFGGNRYPHLKELTVNI